MKRLAAIFAVSALAGCGPAGDNDATQQMQTMMNDAKGTYTFLPNTDTFLGFPARSSDAYDLLIKLDQYEKPVGTKRSLCAHFQTIVVTPTTNGAYSVPYYRNLANQQAASPQYTEITLSDFKPATLLSIPAQLQDKVRPQDPYSLIHTIQEVCIVKPSVK